jgi:hypothetical protein
LFRQAILQEHLQGRFIFGAAFCLSISAPGDMGRRLIHDAHGF